MFPKAIIKTICSLSGRELACMFLFHLRFLKLLIILGICWFMKRIACNRDSASRGPWKLPCINSTLPIGSGSVQSLPAAGVKTSFRLGHWRYQSDWKFQAKMYVASPNWRRNFSVLSWKCKSKEGIAWSSSSKSPRLKSNASTSFQRQVCASTVKLKSLVYFIYLAETARFKPLCWLVISLLDVAHLCLERCCMLIHYQSIVWMPSRSEIAFNLFTIVYL